VQRFATFIRHNNSEVNDMAKILIYGKEKKVTDKLYHILSRNGNEVLRLCPSDGVPAQQDKNTLVVMDARLKWPECRALFHKIQGLEYPVLFLTADQDAVTHLRALYRGRSDVLVIPFSPKAALQVADGLLQHNRPLSPLTVDEETRVAMLGDERVELTAQELALLITLMENPDLPVSREHLLRKAWGYQSMGETRTVDVHVQRLRRKLGMNRIETVYRCGYRLKTA
jgi:two-component system, OmpR family, alkaline phosphatase synthesis response regulator PhoP